MLERLPDDLARQAVTHSSWTERRSDSYERLARRGTIVTYEIVSEEGPPHERTFEVVAVVDGEPLAHGVGRTKKEAEQAAAEAALEAF